MIKSNIKSFIALLSLLATPAAMADYPVGYQDQYFVGQSNSQSNSQSLDVLSNDRGTNLFIADFNRWSVNGGTIIEDSADRGNRRNLIYRPRDGFLGEDEFWYVLEDAQGRRNAAKVKVTVKSTPLNPQNDLVNVKKNTPIRINALGNDSVVLTGPLTAVKIVEFNEWSKRGGRIRLADAAAGTPRQFVYTPRPGFVGEDEFWYAISRFDEGPAAAKVVINVTEYDSSGAYPIGKQDDLVYEYNGRGTALLDYPLDNDVGNNLRIVDRSGWSQKGGRYSIGGPGELVYSPPTSLTENGGTDKIWYVIEDALGRKNWSVINYTVPAFSAR